MRAYSWKGRPWFRSPTTMLLWFWINNLHWLLLFKAILHFVHLARNHTASMRARISICKAINAHAEPTCWRTDFIDSFLCLIEDFERWNTPPTSFLDIAQVFVSTENGSFLLAAAFTRARADSEGTINLDEIWARFCVRNCHVKTVARAKTAPAEKGEIFFRPSNQIFSICQVFKIRSANAAEKFLAPSPPIVTNFHRIARSQGTSHNICP